MKPRNIKTINRCASKLLSGLALAGLIGLSAANAAAQVFAYDDAAAYTTWTNAMNLGYGFGPWTLQETGSGGGNFTGFFVGNSGDPVASTNGNAWGIYANGSSGTNAAVAYRSFINPLTTNTVFKLKWHTKGIGFSPNSLGGFSLRHGNTNGSTTNFDAGLRFAFRYVGGGSDAFLIVDGSGANYTGLSFGSNPFQIEFTLLTANTYRLEVKDAAGVNVLATYDNMILAGSNSINSVALYAFQTDGDQVFNNLEIASTSLIPPEILNVQPLNGAIYVPFTDTISFDVISAFSTVPTNGLTVLLNGATQSNLTVTGPATNRHVVVNSPLPDNLVNSVTITAMDANGNLATNTFSFNTWNSNDPFIEAEDYNFGSGQWINSQQGFDGYLGFDTNGYPSGLFGTNGIDYLEFDPSGATNYANNYYRPYDLPQVEYSSDVPHANLYSDYDLAFNEKGEWENYTRSLSNTTYSVYARMAGFGTSPVMLLERMAAATATSSNQPRATLGTFACRSDTGGSQSYAFVPLEDFFGNPVHLRLPGTNTFRCTCIGSSDSYNFNYLVLIPSTNTDTVLPYLSGGFPSPGGHAVVADPFISFTIANRQTAVVPGSIQLFLDNSNVSSGLSLSNNAAGTVVGYQPSGMVPLNSTNTLRVVFTDGSVAQTNQWQFTVANFPSFSSVSAAAGATNPVNGTVPVTFNAIVNPGNSPTTVAFQFGLTTSYGGSTAVLFVGGNTNAAAVTTTVDGFSPAFTYHYRVVGTNQVGAVLGPDQLLVLSGAAGSNSPPQLSDFANLTLRTNASSGPIPFSVSDAQTPASQLLVTANSSDSTLVPPAHLVLGGSGTNRTLTITTTNRAGLAAIVVTASDGLTFTEKSFVLTVTTNFVAAPPSFTALAQQPGGTILLQMNGTPTVAYTLQTSTNLTDWMDLTNVTPGADGRGEFITTNTAKIPKQFFRLRYP
jgi:hypothetical protein